MEYLSNEGGKTEMLSPAGRTVLEMLAQPASSFVEFDATNNGRPLRSTETQQRTFDQQAQRPDSSFDINQE